MKAMKEKNEELHETPDTQCSPGLKIAPKIQALLARIIGFFFSSMSVLYLSEVPVLKNKPNQTKPQAFKDTESDTDYVVDQAGCDSDAQITYMRYKIKGKKAFATFLSNRMT